MSVYPTKDGYVYIAVGNDKQWGTFTSMPEFKHLAKKEYERNSGRIADVEALNEAISQVTRGRATSEWIDVFVKATIPIAKVNSIEEVTQDPYARDVLIRSKDPVTGTTLTLSPPPVTTEYLQSADFMLTFPPRFGAQNEDIYGKILGYDAEQLREFRERRII